MNFFSPEVPIIYKPAHWFAEQINGLVSISQGALRNRGYLIRLISRNIRCEIWRRSLSVLNVELDIEKVSSKQKTTPKIFGNILHYEYRLDWPLFYWPLNTLIFEQWKRQIRKIFNHNLKNALHVFKESNSLFKIRLKYETIT